MAALLLWEYFLWMQVNLVVGVFFAVWRLFYSLTSTLLNLNRLDVSLFTRGKKLDIGHNTFMSMLVLTVLVQEDHESFAILPDRQPANS